MTADAPAEVEPSGDSEGSRPAGSLRVLWVIKGLGPGGAEQLLVNQARTTRGDIAYAARSLVPEKDQLVPALVAAGVEVRCDATRRVTDLRWLRVLRDELRQGRYDLVHVHSPLLAGWVRLALRTIPAARRPVLVTTEHNRWSQYHPATRWWNRLTYALDDGQIAVSEGVRASMPVRCRRRVEVVVHGIDLDQVRAATIHRQEVRRQWGVGDEVVVVGTVANLRSEKGYEDLIEAARLVTAADLEREVRFVAVGQGPLEPSVRAWHGASGLGDRFQLLGYQPDAVQLMSGFDLFVLASHHEGLPVAVMEAQTQGLAVVATHVGGLPEVVHEGHTGRLVPPHRPDLLAGAIRTMVEDEAARRAMGEAARRASARFDARRATAHLEHRYRELVEVRSPTEPGTPRALRSRANPPGNGTGR
jgi:glycosyltransferase involved in cell wall biosynthesis